MKSSKQSTTTGISSKQLEATYTFFLDNDQGNKVMVDMLLKAGMKVKVHKDYFRPEEPDDVWLPDCARRGWTIISSDKGLETLSINRKALIDSKAKLVILEENNSRAVVWASAIIVARVSLLKLVHQNEGPFVINLSKQTDKLVTGFRKIAGMEVERRRKKSQPKPESLAS